MHKAFVYAHKHTCFYVQISILLRLLQFRCWASTFILVQMYVYVYIPNPMYISAPIAQLIFQSLYALHIHVNICVQVHWWFVHHTQTYVSTCTYLSYIRFSRRWVNIYIFVQMYMYVHVHNPIYICTLNAQLLLQSLCTIHLHINTCGCILTLIICASHTKICIYVHLMHSYSFIRSAKSRYTWICFIYTLIIGTSHMNTRVNVQTSDLTLALSVALQTCVHPCTDLAMLTYCAHSS